MCTVCSAVKARVGSHTSLTYSGGFLYTCHSCLLMCTGKSLLAAFDRIVHTPKTHIHRQKKKNRNLTAPTKNSLIDSSNIIYKVPGEHHKGQLTNLEKTAPRPPKIQRLKRKGRLVGLNQNMKCLYKSRCIQDRKVLFPVQIVLVKSLPRLSFVVKKLFIFFHLWNIKEAT